MNAEGGRRPDLFIVGAPKCGTTALYTYLRQHPDIFMADTKELHFFGSDLERRRTPRLTLEEYLSFFRDADRKARVGEASVHYLQSRLAAREIAAFAPDARVIIMLREPVETMYSMHAEYLYNGSEEIQDFEEALHAEPERRRGLRIPRAVNFAEALCYRDATRYVEQVERYFEALGRQRVHVILFDDFVVRPTTVIAETLRFLGVDDSFSPTLGVINASKIPRSRALQRFLAKPPGWVRRVVRAALPRATRKRAYGSLSRLNAQRVPRPPLDPDLRSRLAAEAAADIRRLGLLIERNLDRWSESPAHG